MNITPIARALFGFTTIAFCLIAFILLSCNQPFDPRGELDLKPVVFCILSTDRNLQFVRVERSYMPAGYDALSDTSDHSIRDAIVTIRDGGLTMRLRDTTLPRSDTSRFKFPLQAYVAGAFKPLYGFTYDLRVERQEREVATASVSIPAKPALAVEISSFAVLDFPADHDSSADILFPITLGNGSAGYIGRFFVDYEILRGGEWVEGRVEVPSGFAFSGLRSYSFLSYPILTHKPSASRTAGVYKNQFYKYALASVAYKDFGTRRIVFNRVVFQLLQVEQNLYNYYVVMHANRDPHSIRLDEPMYSSINGGVGVVGAYTLDSLVHPLPETFIYNHQ